jgi:ATP-dependent Clp protease ATP-binding subunit ClpA
VQSAQRAEVNAGDVLAAMLQQDKSHAARLLAAHGITRLDVLDYISTASPRTPEAPTTRAVQRCAAGEGDEPHPRPPIPLQAYCLNLSDRARRGLLDPLIGRAAELQRTIEVLCRRRKNNPGVRGRGRRGQDGDGRGPASRLLQPDVPDLLTDAEVFSLDTGALLAAPGSAATSRSASRR